MTVPSTQHGLDPHQLFFLCPRCFSNLDKDVKTCHQGCCLNLGSASFGVTVSERQQQPGVSVDQRQQFRRIQSPEVVSTTWISLQIHLVANTLRWSRMPAAVRSRTAAQGDSTSLVVRRSRPCSWGDLGTREQSLPLRVSAFARLQDQPPIPMMDLVQEPHAFGHPLDIRHGR